MSTNPNIFYDDERNVYIDLDTGEEIPIATPPDTRPTAIVTEDMREINEAGSFSYKAEAKDEQLERDRQLALELAASEARHPNTSTLRVSNPRPTSVDHDIAQDLRNMTIPEAPPDNPPSGWNREDWTLARALQSMEIEIAQEVDRGVAFESTEKFASSWLRQIFTVSTLICIAQIVMVGITMGKFGLAPQSINPMIGPYSYILVHFGAKQMSVMVYRDEWWRLITAIFIHAGIWHLLSNVLIQLRVGGYLNILFGTPQWILIYFSSGIFGYMMSGIYATNSIGLGSSGAILGLLAAWSVWIIFRWNKVPKIYHKQRNCQLGTIVVAVLIVVGLSFCPFVDWAQNIGGVIQGLLWGGIVLSHELENIYTKWTIRIMAASLSALSFGLAWRTLSTLDPSLDLLDYYNANDDISNLR